MAVRGHGSEGELGDGFVVQLMREMNNREIGRDIKGRNVNKKSCVEN